MTREPAVVTHRLRYVRLTIVRGLLLAVLATACGDTEDRSVVPVSRPTGPDEVVVQVTVTGGFVPVGTAVSTVPTATVLGDGTVITPAPVIAIYPGPAITPLQSVTVAPGTVDDLVERAAGLGLLDGAVEFGRPPIADAPDTVVTIFANGSEHRHVANALGAGSMPDDVGRQISEQAAANRRALRSFVTAVEALPPGEAPWRPSAVAVYALGGYLPDPDLAQPRREWPLTTPPATEPAAGETIPCTLIENDKVEVLLRALSEASTRTPWMVGGRAVSLAFRPVVPGQPGCPSR